MTPEKQRQIITKSCRGFAVALKSWSGCDSNASKKKRDRVSVSPDEIDVSSHAGIMQVTVAACAPGFLTFWRIPFLYMMFEASGLWGPRMKSSIVKRSITIDGHRTSVSLEETFWSDLKRIARAQDATLSELVAKIDHTRERGTLSTAIRLYVLEHIHLVGGAPKAGPVLIALKRD
jgi:predicted DNA-binding ribbon-helix-helix protein